MSYVVGWKDWNTTDTNLETESPREIAEALEHCFADLTSILDAACELNPVIEWRFPHGALQTQRAAEFCYAQPVGGPGRLWILANSLASHPMHSLYSYVNFGKKARILLPDPYCEAYLRRAAAAGYEPSGIARWLRVISDKFEITELRLFSSPLPYSITVLPNENMLVRPYLNRKTGHSSPVVTFEPYRDRESYKILMKVLESAWENGTALTQDDLSKLLVRLSNSPPTPLAELIASSSQSGSVASSQQEGVVSRHSSSSFLVTPNDTHRLPEAATLPDWVGTAREDICIIARSVGKIINLTTRQVLGTAWLYDVNIAVTCLHVSDTFSSSNSVHAGKIIQIEFTPQTVYNVERVLTYVRDADLVTLHVTPEGTNTVHPLKNYVRKPEVIPNHIFLVGFPHTYHKQTETEEAFPQGIRTKTLSFGEITGDRKHNKCTVWRHSCNTLGGCSGAPVFDSALNLIGIHTEFVSNSNSFVGVESLIRGGLPKQEDWDRVTSDDVLPLLRPSDLIQPIFVTRDRDGPIESLSNLCYTPLASVVHSVEELRKAGVRTVLLFSVPSPTDRNGDPVSLHRELGVAAAALLADVDIEVWVDCCVCDASHNGECIIVDDATTSKLVQAIVEAYLAALPSLGAVVLSCASENQLQLVRNVVPRDSLTKVLPYLKFASDMYGPFRRAMGSPFTGTKLYQLNPTSEHGAIQRLRQLIAQGADGIIVKPAMLYLDIIAKCRDFISPEKVYAFSVSGEYCLIQSDTPDTFRLSTELLHAIYRAGARKIITYDALSFSQQLALKTVEPSEDDLAWLTEWTKLRTTSQGEELIRNMELLRGSELEFIADIIVGKSAIQESAASDGTINSCDPFCFGDPGWRGAAYSLFRSFTSPRPAFGKTPAIIQIDNIIEFNIVGDWGTGTMAPAFTTIRDLITRNQKPYHIHLGDVYYSGSPEEQSVFVANWPSGSIGSFTLNSNHEMYYRKGAPYFEITLNNQKFALQQNTSFFALYNDHWLLFGLDSAYAATPTRFYMDGRLNRIQKEFITTTRQRFPTQKVVILSHHTPISLNGAKTFHLYHQVVSALGEAPSVWIYGHQHSGIVYKPMTAGVVTLFRCVGHGAIPYMPSTTLSNSACVVWQEQATTPFHSGQRALNGYAVLRLAADSHSVSFFSETGGCKHVART